MEQIKSSTKLTVADLAKMALVTSLYVVLTMVLTVVSFGPLQLRLAEMFNFLPLFNKRYIWSVTLGVVIANMGSPMGIIDVVIGSIGTLAVLFIVCAVTKHVVSMKVKMLITAGIFAFSMFTVAGQLTYFFELPFFATWLSVGISELFSMTIGGLIIYSLSKKIDLTK